VDASNPPAFRRHRSRRKRDPARGQSVGRENTGAPATTETGTGVEIVFPRIATICVGDAVVNPYGNTALICPELTKINGTLRPPITTPSLQVDGQRQRGRRLRSLRELRAEHADNLTGRWRRSGVEAGRVHHATGMMIGTPGLSATDPEMAHWPEVPRSGCVASTVTIVGLTLAVTGVQVAHHFPAPSLTNVSGVSPFEKVATTEPLAMGIPHSSRTFTSTT
jgi:hypothetical protein